MKKLFLILLCFVFCMGTAIAYTQPFFVIKIDSINPREGSFIHSDDLADIVISVTNLGVKGCMKIEGGIYEKEAVNKWYGGKNMFAFIGVDVPNCADYETNVDTRYVCLAEGGTGKIELNVRVPRVSAYDMSGCIGSFCSPYTNKFGVHAQAFKNCWSAQQDTGQTSFATKSIIVWKSMIVAPKETCTDGIKNQDESDIDCGGVCKNCQEGGDCIYDADCEEPQYKCKATDSKYSITGRICTDTYEEEVVYNPDEGDDEDKIIVCADGSKVNDAKECPIEWKDSDDENEISNKKEISDKDESMLKVIVPWAVLIIGMILSVIGNVAWGIPIAIGGAMMVLGQYITIG